MTTSKFRRACSVRIPRSPKPAVFLDTYDRLEDTECQGDLTGLCETPGNRDSTFFSWDVPLITDAPKLQYCRKKWCSKSLRVPKTRVTETVSSDSQLQVVSEMDGYCTDSWQEPVISTINTQTQWNDSQKREEVENEGEKQKGNKIKNYKKSIDRVFRRGWGNLITNIYTISLTKASHDAPQLVKAC
ncbi:Hypothetical predicted protein [Pelobates cultripes]|uniref:Uncharacterized protein n=1 Tax=Pelobates cultripes TaxID=61616 RepID=A0AAD1TGV5_PELCU|nr:Hypothetical predicted protein [Pelobates cultripes]